MSVSNSKLILIVLTLSFSVFLYLFSHRSNFHTYKDPTGEYTVLLTYRTFYSYIPMSIGSASDKSGFVEIRDSDGKSFGEIPLGMLQLADLSWTKNGAEVKLIGEWNFKEEYCWYWNKDQDKQIIVKGNPPKLK